MTSRRTTPSPGRMLSVIAGTVSLGFGSTAIVQRVERHAAPVSHALREAAYATLPSRSARPVPRAGRPVQPRAAPPAKRRGPVRVKARRAAPPRTHLKAPARTRVAVPVRTQAPIQAAAPTQPAQTQVQVIPLQAPAQAPSVATGTASPVVSGGS